LSWSTDFRADGTFSVAFFSDAERTHRLYRETGNWVAVLGKRAMSIRGVHDPDFSSYKVLDADTVRFESIKPGPTADCHAYYVFTEYRILK
jgi:hypothetical protein